MWIWAHNSNSNSVRFVTRSFRLTNESIRWQTSEWWLGLSNSSRMNIYSKRTILKILINVDHRWIFSVNGDQYEVSARVHITRNEILQAISIKCIRKKNRLEKESSEPITLDWVLKRTFVFIRTKIDSFRFLYNTRRWQIEMSETLWTPTVVNRIKKRSAANFWCTRIFRCDEIKRTVGTNERNFDVTQ